MLTLLFAMQQLRLLSAMVKLALISHSLSKQNTCTGGPSAFSGRMSERCSPSIKKAGCICLFMVPVCLQWEDALASFKTRLASGQDVFGPLIRKYLLDNKHRCVSACVE